MVGTYALSAGHTGMVRKELGLRRMREIRMDEDEPCSCLFLVTCVVLISGLPVEHLAPRCGSLLLGTSKCTR